MTLETLSDCIDAVIYQISLGAYTKRRSTDRSALQKDLCNCDSRWVRGSR